MKCAIESCSYQCRNMKELVEHLNVNHGQHLEYEHLEFKCRDELKEWQTQIEKETPCRFKRKTGRVPKQTEYFYCNRSGSSNLKPNGNRKRHLKTQGSCKIQRNCTAHFTTFQKTADCIEVKYMAKHFCHTNIINQLGHLRVHESERKWLAGKLAQNIPIEIILRDIRLDLDVALERSHIVTKQDLRNIQQAFEQKRQKAMQLCSDAVLIVQAAQTNEQLDVIIDCMKTIRPKLEAVIASSHDSINFVQMPQVLNEPSNKGVEHQRRFVSTKRKRAKVQNEMTKPSVADRREIQNDLIFGKRSNPTEPVDHEEPTSLQQTPSDLSTVCNKRLKLTSENITQPGTNKTLLQLQPLTVFPEYLADISKRNSISQMRTEICKPCTAKQIVTIPFCPKFGPPPKVHIVSTK